MHGTSIVMERTGVSVGDEGKACRAFMWPNIEQYFKLSGYVMPPQFEKGLASKDDYDVPRTLVELLLSGALQNGWPRAKFEKKELDFKGTAKPSQKVSATLTVTEHYVNEVGASYAWMRAVCRTDDTVLLEGNVLVRLP